MVGSMRIAAGCVPELLWSEIPGYWFRVWTLQGGTDVSIDVERLVDGRFYSIGGVDGQRVRAFEKGREICQDHLRQCVADARTLAGVKGWTGSLQGGKAGVSWRKAMV